MTMARTAKEKQAGGAETMEVLLGRSPEIPSKMVDDWERIVLDLPSSDESTIHPGNDLLVQALQHYFGNTYLVQPVHDMVGFWGSKMEQDAELIRPGDKCRKYIFLLNNTCVVRQMVRRPGASFPDVEPLLTSMIKRYRKCYLDECWAPLKCLSSEEFTAEFLATCNRQMKWKVAAEVRYKLRQEIAELIVPPCDGSHVIEGLFEG
ncbi:hypothetical protein CFC21_014638 [Triticum aestivum]|uniref:Exocyst subunit Exo70 family protein n=2 Tax=Triticum aestivum TaxID=4565 RepID=A0A3B6APG7_WHEAT|nr:uncharacterized protein LOC123184317 [Triticum aestivum]KAF6998522.1 hypothetical protein CFC21_014638 [Triticum aestivum]